MFLRLELSAELLGLLGEGGKVRGFRTLRTRARAPVVHSPLVMWNIGKIDEIRQEDSSRCVSMMCTSQSVE
jgi:hypothetical protein